MIPFFVIAECPVCGAGRFLAPRKAPEAADVLTCESCSLKLTSGFLHGRMGKAAAANDAPKQKPKRKAAVRPRRQRKRG
jgi:hypothetical protein